MKAMAAVVLAVAVLGGCAIGGERAPDLVGTWRFDGESIGPRVSSISLEMTLDANGTATTTLVQQVPLDAEHLAGCTVTRIDASAAWDVDGGELTLDGGGKIVYSRHGCASAADDVPPEVRDALEADATFVFELAPGGEALVVHHATGGRQVDQTFRRVRR